MFCPQEARMKGYLDERLLGCSGNFPGYHSNALVCAFLDFSIQLNNIAQAAYSQVIALHQL